MGHSLSMGISEIYDGASNTMLLDEVRVGLVAGDPRGTWALDVPAASTLWAHAWGDANGPNLCSDGVDNLLDCDALKTASPGLSVLRAECMTCSFYAGGNDQGIPRSRHPGGLYATMADGSVRFISNYIEKGNASSWTIVSPPSLTSTFLCWQRLCASQDGQVIDGNKF